MCTCMLHACMPHPARDYTHKRCTNMREHREILFLSHFRYNIWKKSSSPQRPGITAGAVSNRISSSEIHRAAGSSLATLLERISGVSSLSTGTTVSKPVIHGMHGNRILIINNVRARRGNNGRQPCPRSRYKRKR